MHRENQREENWRKLNLNKLWWFQASKHLKKEANHLKNKIFIEKFWNYLIELIRKTQKRTSEKTLEFLIIIIFNYLPYEQINKKGTTLLDRISSLQTQIPTFLKEGSTYWHYDQSRSQKKRMQRVLLCDGLLHIGRCR